MQYIIHPDNAFVNDFLVKVSNKLSYMYFFSNDGRSIIVVVSAAVVIIIVVIVIVVVMTFLHALS